MNALAHTTGRGRARTSRTSSVGRRRITLAAVLALAAASSLVLVTDLHVGPWWVHWVSSLVAIAAALGVVVIAELGWHRAITTAKMAGLVAPETHI
jgi:membrane protein YdbS with pleckstrin-like domain